jgi:hypothetical protein
MVTLNGEKILDDVVRAYHAACLKHGRRKELGEDMIWGAGIYLADSREAAMGAVEPAHDERFKWFAQFGFVRYADEQGRQWGTPGAPARSPSFKDGVDQKAWFCGTPAEVIDGIKSIAREISWPRDVHAALARGADARRVQGSAPPVRARRDAGVQAALREATSVELPILVPMRDVSFHGEFRGLTGPFADIGIPVFLTLSVVPKLGTGGITPRRVAARLLPS